MRYQAHYYGAKIDARMPEPIFHNSPAEAAGVAKHAWEAAQREGDSPRTIVIKDMTSGDESTFQYDRLTALAPGQVELVKGTEG